MASQLKNEYECLDEEVRELLRNYKHKKATIYEPCTLNNLKECLIGLSEEFGLFNITYVFNPHIDMDNDILGREALVKLINSVWTLLQYYKNISEKSDKLVEQNHAMEQHNKQLLGLVDKLKEKINSEKNEAKACVASAQRIADRSDDMMQKLTKTKAKLHQVEKQKDTTEKGLKNEISRLKIQNEKLLDRLRNKGASCGETCDVTVLQLKDKERHQRATIAHLQKMNQDLLHQVLDMKEELLLSGLPDLSINDKK